MNPINRIIETTRRYFQTEFEKPQPLSLLGNSSDYAPIQTLSKEDLQQSLPQTASAPS